MATPPDRLARQFVDSALELYRRRPWNELPGDAIFLVRVPTEEDPLAANVMGQDGEQFGLSLVRGEGAFRRMAGLFVEDTHPEGFTEAGDLLSVTFEPWSNLPEEFRRLLLAAGLRARRERPVPFAFAKRPYEHMRPVGRGDLRTLTWIVRGVLAAQDAGELQPPSLDWGRRRVLELEVGGELKAPTVTARIVPWPEDVNQLDLPPLVALPADLAGLPRLEQRWLLARLPMAAEIRGDDRTVAAVFIAAEDGFILANCLVQGDELAPVAEALSKAFRGKGFGRRRGLPREIVFDSPRLLQALAPALAGFDVESVFDDEYPPILELAAEIEASADEFAGEEEECEAPETLLDWKAVDRRVVSRLVVEAVGKRDPSSRALARYFGFESEAQRVLGQLEQFSPFGAFVEWLAADYRATKRSKTVVEKLLEGRRVAPAERVLLEARKSALLSIFRVDSCEPGATLEVEDILSGERYTIHDRAMSSGELEGILVPLRLLRVEDWIFPVIAGPPLTALEVDRALRGLERLGLELSPEGLRRDAHLVGRLWSWLLERERRPVGLQNTDGDPFELHTATFVVDDPAALRRALEERDDLDHDEEQDRWVWLRASPPAPARGEAPAPRTVLGSFEILDERLVLEVNSARRLERAREWLEAVPGVRFERATQHALDDPDRPLDDRLPGPPPEPLTPEMVQLQEQLIREHYFRWLDEPVPLLDDMTPRQACATAEGRRRVARLVRSMPAAGIRGETVEVPRAELLRELGIAPEE